MTQRSKLSRTSRDQETKENNPVHENTEYSFDDEGPLPNVEPRPGYTQRWVRISLKGSNDRNNIYKAMRAGWKPREASTLGAIDKFLTSVVDGLGDVISAHDLVLMERHEDITAKEKAAHVKRYQDKERAIKKNLVDETIGGAGYTAGMAAPNHRTEQSVERGRSPLVADD